MLVVLIAPPPVMVKVTAPAVPPVDPPEVLIAWVVMELGLVTVPILIAAPVPVKLPVDDKFPVMMAAVVESEIVAAFPLTAPAALVLMSPVVMAPEVLVRATLVAATASPAPVAVMELDAKLMAPVFVDIVTEPPIAVDPPDTVAAPLAVNPAVPPRVAGAVKAAFVV
jgi:hypothetical protein